MELLNANQKKLQLLPAHARSRPTSTRAEADNASQQICKAQALLRHNVHRLEPVALDRLAVLRRPEAARCITVAVQRLKRLKSSASR